jgi:hypothetical protein
MCERGAAGEDVSGKAVTDEGHGTLLAPEDGVFICPEPWHHGLRSFETGARYGAGLRTSSARH